MKVSISTHEYKNTATIVTPPQFTFSIYRSFTDSYKAIEDDIHHWVVDLTNTEYLDSAALGMLVAFRSHLGSDGQNITLRGAKDDVRSILEVANFQKLFRLA